MRPKKNPRIDVVPLDEVMRKTAPAEKEKPVIKEPARDKEKGGIKQRVKTEPYMIRINPAEARA